MTSIAVAVRQALLTGEATGKVMAARKVTRDWRLGRLEPVWDADMPEVPARPDALILLPPNRMPRRRGKGLPAQVAMVHALAHIEFVAIDLALDMAGRFGGNLPEEFTTAWLSVAADEAMHFALLERRLHQLGSQYGALPAHDGLWEAASVTTDDVLARLAIVPMVLEARGLDICPATIDRFTAIGDDTTANIVRRILSDEIRHVGTGAKWFKSLCSSQRIAWDAHWQFLVSSRFRGQLKPPFNDSARESAGLTRQTYHALASDIDVAQ